MAQVIKHVQKYAIGGSFTYNGKTYTGEQLDDFVHNSGLTPEEIAALEGTVSAVKNGENRSYDAANNSLSGNNVNDDFIDYFGSQRRANKGKSGWGRGKRNRHATRQSDYYTRDLALSKLSGIESYFSTPTTGNVAIPQIPTQAAEVAAETGETPELTAEQKLAQLKQQYSDSGYDYDQWAGIAELGQDGKLRVRTDELGRPVIRTGNAYFNDSFVKSIKSDEDTSNDDFEFLKDHFLIDGVFYKASDAKLVGSELYNKLREVNGWYDLNKSGKWEDANKIIRQFWGENESPLKASDFGSYNEVFANNPNLYYRTVTGGFNLTNPDNQVVELFDPTGEVNEFGWYTPKYYEFDANGNRTHWTNDGKEERVIPTGIVGVSDAGLTGETVTPETFSKKFGAGVLENDGNGNFFYKEEKTGNAHAFSSEFSQELNKLSGLWEKLENNPNLKKRFESALGSLFAEPQYSELYSLTAQEWEQLVGDKELSMKLVQLFAKERMNAYQNNRKTKTNFNITNQGKFVDETLIPQTMKQGGILKGQNGLPYAWWNNEGDAFKTEFSKLTSEQIWALTPEQRAYAKARLATTGLKGPESDWTAPVNGTAKEDAWKDTTTTVDPATLAEETKGITTTPMGQFSTFDRNSIKATPYTPEQRAVIEAQRKAYAKRGYIKSEFDENGNFAASTRLSRERAAEQAGDYSHIIEVTEEPEDISLDAQFARDLSRQDFRTLREEQGLDRDRTRAARKEARIWERNNSDDPAGNLVGESNAGRNYSDLFRIAKLANAFRADRQQRELARQERDAAMSNMEQNVPEYYSRYSDYGIGNQYRQAANQYRQPSNIANSDINAVLADQRIRNAQATQIELEGGMKQSQNFSEWKNQQDQLRRTYAEARTGVENRNRATVAQAQVGYLNRLGASIAQRQNVVDNALTEQLALYNQDRQLGYDLRVKSDQYVAQQQLASVREKYNNMLQSYRNNNPSKANATLTDMFIEFPQLKAQMEREVAEINNAFTQQQLKTAGRWGRQSSFPIQFAKKGGSVYKRKPVSEIIWEDNNKEAQKAVRQLSKQAYEFLKMALK